LDSKRVITAAGRPPYDRIVVSDHRIVLVMVKRFSGADNLLKGFPIRVDDPNIPCFRVIDGYMPTRRGDGGKRHIPEMGTHHELVPITSLNGYGVVVLSAFLEDFASARGSQKLSADAFGGKGRGYRAVSHALPSHPQHAASVYNAG
jgi:hypothetical protein